MIQWIIITALIVQAIWYSMQPGEIFGGLRSLLTRVLPGRLHSPVFDCPICMTPWYGLIIVMVSGVFIEGPRPALWPFILLAAMGLNVVISKLDVYRDSE